MLPEGAHNRDVDSTYIFLNRQSSHIDQDIWTCLSTESVIISKDTEKEVTKKNTETEANADTTNDTTFLYGLNVVKTKYDNNVRRGAIVKALCLFSKYQFVDALKQPLEQALELYFNRQEFSTLESIYRSLNETDLSVLPRPNMLEQCLMRRGVTFENAQISEIKNAQRITDNNTKTLHGLSTKYDHVPCVWNKSLQVKYTEDKEVQLMPIPISIPIWRTPDEFGEVNMIYLVQVSIHTDSLFIIYCLYGIYLLLERYLVTR